MLWPVLVHKDRQGDAALKKIAGDMTLMAGAEAFARQQTAIMTRPDSRPGLPAIKCPTLVLVGDGDQLTPPRSVGGDGGAHSGQQAGGGAALRASLDARAAGGGDAGAGGVDGGVSAASEGLRTVSQSPAHNPPVDDQQRRADDERADRLAQAERLAQYEMREHDCADRHQQRDQHDIGRAGATEYPVEDEVRDAGRENAETDRAKAMS